LKSNAALKMTHMLAIFVPMTCKPLCHVTASALLVWAMQFPLTVSAQTEVVPGAGPQVEVEHDSTRVNGTRLAIVGGTVAAGMVAIHIYQHNAWWRGARGPFHVEEDLRYAKNIDKLGHLYAANLLTFGLSRSLRWTNVGEEPALVWGAVGSTLFETYIEVEDGFAVHWGFDRVDFAADVFGAWYPVAQHAWPFLRNFNFRFSYLPKTPGSEGPFPGQTHTVFDDYEGQTIWLTLTMKNLLPSSWAEVWPSPLCLSFGLAVRNNLSADRYLTLLIAPDLDLTKIFPADSEFLQSLGAVLNFIHFPLPAVRVSPNVVWYGLYF